MDLLNTLNRLGDVESGFFLLKGTMFEQQVQHVAPSKILHHQVQIVIVLEGILKIRHPRTMEQPQEILLFHKECLTQRWNKKNFLLLF